MKRIFIFPECSDELGMLLENAGFLPIREFSKDVDFVISVGGDGTFLRACQAIGFADVPIIGINTGHLGYFTELMPDEMHKLVGIFQNGDYTIQEYKLIESCVETSESSFDLNLALNDVQVRHQGTTMIHLKVNVGNNFVETFFGDGVLVSSSAGSTAYNYSLGGSIVDPRISLLQMVPIAPANNKSYRCFTSSIIVPAEQELVIEPEDINNNVVIIDGIEIPIKDLKKITISLSDKSVKIIRLPGYDFWGKVKSKLL